MKQITREDALAIHDGEKWKSWTPEQIVAFQLYQQRLFVPFTVFRESLEQVLGREVGIHELCWNPATTERIIREYEQKLEGKI